MRKTETGRPSGPASAKLSLAALVLSFSAALSCRADPLPPVIPAGPLEPICDQGTREVRASPPTKETPKEGKPMADAAAWAAVLPPPAQVLPIDLCTALRLAEAENPTIAISRQAIQEALAQQLQADVLLLPSLRAGVNYRNHNGVLQSSIGEMRDVESSSLYAGGGARALAADTVAFPMVQVFSPLADAFLEPLVARRLIAVRSAQSDATSNQMLLEVARRFLELVSAEAELGALRKSEEEMGLIADLTASFARAGQGREADAHRGQAEFLLVRIEVEGAEERVAVAS